MACKSVSLFDKIKLQSRILIHSIRYRFIKNSDLDYFAAELKVEFIEIKLRFESSSSNSLSLCWPVHSFIRHKCHQFIFLVLLVHFITSVEP